MRVTKMYNCNKQLELKLELYININYFNQEKNKTQNVRRGKAVSQVSLHARM